MSDPFHAQAQLRKREYEMEFLDGLTERRDVIHDDGPWCTDRGGQACERCAPLLERARDIRAQLPRLQVWFENLVEAVLYRYWRIRIRLEQRLKRGKA